MLPSPLIQISSYLVTGGLCCTGRPVSPRPGEQIQYLALRLGLKRTFQVRRSDRVRTAMVLGVLRPVLLILRRVRPSGGPSMSLTTCAAGTWSTRADDGSLLAALVQPLVWWMSRVAGRNLELCCDEDVAGKENSAFRHRYGRLLLECAAEGAGPFSPAALAAARRS